MRDVKILECSLRDGTYILDFMIEPETFLDYTRRLINLGYEHIEVGHGLGLGAHRYYSAGFTDRSLWDALAPVARQAKLYSFFIPYVGTREDIDIAVDRGLYGLRLGMEPLYVKKYIPLIEYARSKGLFVAINLMKSYTMTPRGVARTLGMVKDLVDVSYLVDSAGCMLPSEAKEYVDAVFDHNGMISMGYHGHNNLSLAVATALQLMDAGVEYIDTTLTGIGRSGGNVPTETMIAVLGKRFGNTYYSRDFFLKTLALASDFKHYVESKGKRVTKRSDDILFGYAGFHSSFENRVRTYARKYGLDFRDLILAVSDYERIKVTDEVLDEVMTQERDDG